MDLEDIRGGYNRVVKRYAQEFQGELERKPLDRALLECFVGQVAGQGLVVDMGCGPGHLAGWLQQHGLAVLGLDLSEQMVRHAAAAVPSARFAVGNMLALDAADASWAGIAAFYSIVHLEPEEVAVACAQFHRVLMPGGRLLLAFHAGTERVALEQWLGATVKMEWVFHVPARVEEQLRAAGFHVETTLVRAPYPGVEHPSQRAYIMAQRPLAK